MKETGIERKVDELGRIVLPMEVRKKFGIEEKDSLDILIDEEKEYIILKKSKKCCLKCGSTERLKELKNNVYICEECLNKVKLKKGTNFIQVCPLIIIKRIKLCNEVRTTGFAGCPPYESEKKPRY